MPEVSPVSLQWLVNEIDESTPDEPAYTPVSRSEPMPVEIVDTREPQLVTIEVNIPLTAGAYSAGDAVGPVFEIPNMARFPGGGGIINTVSVENDAGQTDSMTLYLYDRKVAGVADNAAFTGGTDAEARRMQKPIPLSWYPVTAPTLNNITGAAGIGQQYNCAPGERGMWGQLQTNGTPTHVANGVTLKIGVFRE